MRIILSVVLAWLAALGLAGCGAKEAALKPYKLEIQQGNIVTSKMLLQLRPGMTKSQVRYIMGTPLIVDSFHDNRWDYFYQLRQGGKIVQQRRVILDFDNELLAHVRGDVVPQGTAGADTSDAPVSQSIAKPAKEKSLLDKLEFWKSDKKEATDKPLATEPALVNPSASPTESSAPQEPAVPEQPASQPGQEEGAASGSMLAVPIPLVPSTQSPAAPAEETASPATAPATPPSANEGAVVTEPIDTSPVESASPAKAEPLSAPETVAPAASEPAPVEAPAATAAPRTVPKQQPAEEKVSEPVVPVEKPVVVTPAAKTTQSRASQPADADQPANQPPAASDEELDPPPGYFERLLEKIGF